MTKHDDDQIYTFIVEQFLGDPHLVPPVNERVERELTIQSEYWRRAAPGLTPAQAKKSAPAISRIRAGFRRLVNEHALDQTPEGWRLSEPALLAHAAAELQSANDLLDASPAKRSRLKLFGLFP